VEWRTTPLIGDSVTLDTVGLTELSKKK